MGRFKPHSTAPVPERAILVGVDSGTGEWTMQGFAKQGKELVYKLRDLILKQIGLRVQRFISRFNLRGRCRASCDLLYIQRHKVIKQL